MKQILILVSLVLCSLASANSQKDYVNYKLSQMEGEYEGEYGVFLVKRCTVSVFIRGAIYPENLVTVKVSQAEGGVGEVRIKLKEFMTALSQETLDDKLVYNFRNYFLKFNNDLELTEVKIMKKNAETIFDKLRCRQLIKR